MKRILAGLLAVLLSATAVQAAGAFKTLELNGFKLHIYNSGDVMADTSLIVEGKDALVTMELPLFKANAKEFDAFAAKLKKPVAQVITDYHEGARADAPVVMPEGMPAFIRGEVYTGMMKHFAKSFGDAMVSIAEPKSIQEVPFGKPVELAGVVFTFNRGSETDFPAASINIGKQVYYMHWAPAKAHASHLQISSPAAIDAELAATKAALESGCQYVVGGHGGLVGVDDVKFRINYLETLKKLYETSNDAESFQIAVRKAYPGLKGEEGLKDLVNALYEIGD